MRNYYDALFADMEGTYLYRDFLLKHLKGPNVIEFASGTSDLMNLLSDAYDYKGVDIDLNMINTALSKYPHLEDRIVEGNFLNYRENKRYDSLVCVGDSLNYLQDETELEQFVETATQLSDHIIVDFHHPYRLTEFEDSYFEEGSTDTFDYLYNIEVFEDKLVHTINFLDGTYDTVVQWVFLPTMIIDLFAKYGYMPTIYTDFDFEGILDKGEKLMIIFDKGGSI
jgi:hypothetical protein